jgi:hypothetical protein
MISLWSSYLSMIIAAAADIRRCAAPLYRSIPGQPGMTVTRSFARPGSGPPQGQAYDLGGSAPFPVSFPAFFCDSELRHTRLSARGSVHATAGQVSRATCGSSAGSVGACAKGSPKPGSSRQVKAQCPSAEPDHAEIMNGGLRAGHAHPARPAGNRRAAKVMRR